jgi:hypothetical protein
MEAGQERDKQPTQPEGSDPVAGEEGFAPPTTPLIGPQVVAPVFGWWAVLAILAVVALLAWQAGEAHYQSCVVRAAVDGQDPDGCTVFPWSKPD